MAFEARWSGACADCEEGFAVGDYIDRTPTGYYRHAGVCPEVREAKVGAICPKCFTAQPLTGKCGCDE